MNKIGKNPSIVSNRDDLTNDCKTVNAIVTALASVAATEEQQEAPTSSEESVAAPGQAGSKHLYHNMLDLGSIGKALAQGHLPRPKSENNFALSLSQQASPLNRHRRSFHKSDTFHKDTSFE